jgi:hypothetical protein
VRNLNKKLT